MKNDDVYIDPNSFYGTLRALKKLGKEANAELRQESRKIAENILKPIVQASILKNSGAYGPKLASTVRVKGDRVPTVLVGQKSKRYGDARRNTLRAKEQRAAKRNNVDFNKSDPPNTLMLKFGTIKGPYIARSGALQEWAQSVTPGWTQDASNHYIEPVYYAWEKAVLKVIDNAMKTEI